MTNATTNDTAHTQKVDPYAQMAMSWYGWGSPIGFSILILSCAASVYLLHQAGLWR